ncbi:MAG: HlyC/CorC family transporter [SAR202 cluster bacterium]|nr:HlyC/CorC family transporter [SAR202 cluster bacterium]
MDTDGSLYSSTFLLATILYLLFHIVVGNLDRAVTTGSNKVVRAIFQDGRYVTELFFVSMIVGSFVSVLYSAETTVTGISLGVILLLIVLIISRSFSNYIGFQLPISIKYIILLFYPFFLIILPLNKLNVLFGDPSESKNQPRSLDEYTDDLAEQINIANGDDQKEESGLEPHERMMITSILKLDQTTAREIMIPRMDIIGAPSNHSLSQIAELMADSGHSRIPIYGETLDNVIGVLHSRDMLGTLDDNEKGQDIAQVVRTPLFIPESKRLDDLLRDFQDKRIQIAIVVDEYGGTAGLVTIEDLLEEIVGEIEDEFDSGESITEIISDDEAVMDARIPLDDVNEIFGLNLQGDGFDTLGGLIYHELGKIPVPGDELQHDSIRLQILTTLGRRIKRVTVKKVQ